MKKQQQTEPLNYVYYDPIQPKQTKAEIARQKRLVDEENDRALRVTAMDLVVRVRQTIVGDSANLVSEASKIYKWLKTGK